MTVCNAMSGIGISTVRQSVRGKMLVAQILNALLIM